MRKNAPYHTRGSRSSHIESPGVESARQKQVARQRRLIIPQRPTSITVLSWLCIVFGVGGFLVNFDWLTTPVYPLFGSNPLGMIIQMREPAWLTRLYPYHSYSDMHPLAMWLFPAQWLFLAVCGVFMLYGFNWARWMLVAWVGYYSFHTIAHTRFELMFEVFTHIHSPWESLVYLHLFIAILYIVFRPEASRYFRGAQATVRQ